ncbi:MAG TPA: hypothetical protein VFI24_06670 [Pyrinomonadaceae bacterium]|nr:hypothetical protein [Pyrinomonadaceae bacterium]
MITFPRLILIITFFFPIQAVAASPSLDEQWLDGASGYNLAIELQRE